MGNIADTLEEHFAKLPHYEYFLLDVKPLSFKQVENELKKLGAWGWELRASVGEQWLIFMRPML